MTNANNLISELEIALAAERLKNADLERELNKIKSRQAASEEILRACIKKFENLGKYHTADKLRAMFERWVVTKAQAAETEDLTGESHKT